MRAGEYDREVEVLKPTITRNALNEPITTWSVAFKMWAATKNGKGGEFYAAQKLYAEATDVFLAWYNTTTAVINTTYRIRYSGHTYEILNVHDLNFNHSQIVITAKEVV